MHNSFQIQIFHSFRIYITTYLLSFEKNEFIGNLRAALQFLWPLSLSFKIIH